MLILLGVVLYDRADSSHSNDGAGLGTNETGPRRRKSSAAVVAQPALKWPKFALEEVLLHNPFEPAPMPVEETKTPEAAPVLQEPLPTPEAIREENASEDRRKSVAAVIAELKQQRVRMILRTDKSVSAVIGDRVLRAGDVFDGVRVKSILPNGIVVEPAETDPQSKAGGE